MMMMTTKERDDLDRLEAKNSRNSIHFLTVAETTRLFWLRDRKADAVTKPYKLTEYHEYQLSRMDQYQRVCCDICHVRTHADDIVWRGSDGKLAVCDECEPEGDDCR